MPFDGVSFTQDPATGIWEIDNPLILRKHRTHDALNTYDSNGSNAFAQDSNGNMRGRSFDRAFRTHDSKFADSTGAFMLGELIRLDQSLHLPLATVSWARDVPLRQDVTMADEGSSWTVSTFGSPGGLGMSNAITGGKAWIGKDTTEVSSVSVDIGLNTKPLRPWALELKYTVLELESALKLGRPVDQQKYEAIKMKHQMDVDAQAYVGDSDMGDTGLVNSVVSPGPGLPGVGSITSLPNGTTSNNAGFMAKNPSEVLSDINFALTTTWANAAWAVVPSRILMPPAQYGYLSTELVSTAGTTSILRYVEENNILTRSGQGKLEIYPSKWCAGAGVGGTIGTAGPGTTDRMVVYCKNDNYLRLPLTLLARTPIQYDSIYQKATYYGKLGVLEIVYPETIAYYDKV